MLYNLKHRMRYAGYSGSCTRCCRYLQCLAASHVPCRPACCWAVGRRICRCSGRFLGHRTATDKATEDGSEARRGVREKQTPVAADGGLPLVLGVQVDGADLRSGRILSSLQLTWGCTLTNVGADVSPLSRNCDCNKLTCCIPSNIARWIDAACARAGHRCIHALLMGHARMFSLCARSVKGSHHFVAAAAPHVYLE